MTKKILYLLMAYFIIGVSWAQPQSTEPATQNSEPEAPINRIVAIVNDEIITQTDLDTAVEQMQQQYIVNKQPLPAADKLRSQALDQLINYRLLMQMAIRYDVKPTVQELDQAIEQIAKSHGLTVDQMKEQLTLQHMTYEEFRKKINEQLTITKLEQQMVAGQVKVTDADIAAFKSSVTQGNEEYKLIDFFIPISETPSAAELDQALTTAHEIQKQIESGVDIDKITPAYQDLGWRTKDDLPQLFIQQLSTLTLKNASQPLRAPNGYHVLKLMDQRNSNQTLTDDQIRQLVLRKKYEVAITAAVNKARKEAYVQIIPE